eukprot:4431645-Pleurochrysis_carterae.AAC.1
MISQRLMTMTMISQRLMTMTMISQRTGRERRDHQRKQVEGDEEDGGKDATARTGKPGRDTVVEPWELRASARVCMRARVRGRV